MRDKFVIKALFDSLCRIAAHYVISRNILCDNRISGDIAFSVENAPFAFLTEKSFP